MEKLDLNTLINNALGTKDQDYTSSEGMDIFKKAFEDISGKDKSALIIFLYFFPICPPMVKHDIGFWFTKYKNVENYNEYKFAKDILIIYNQYLSDKDNKSFEINILKKMLAFKNYKFIGDFLSVVKNYDDKIIATISYITKDNSYFATAFETKVEPDKIQENIFINKIGNYLEKKNLLDKFRKAIEMVKTYSNLLQEEKTSKGNLISRISSLEKEMSKFKNVNVTLNGEISDLKNVNVTLNGEISDLKNDNVTLNKELFKLKGEIQKSLI